jgi:hypothetical protein
VKRGSLLWNFLHNQQRMEAYARAFSSGESTTAEFFTSLDEDYFAQFHWSTLWGNDPPEPFPLEPVTPEEVKDARQKRSEVREVRRPNQTLFLLFDSTLANIRGCTNGTTTM